jgi:hypothetical protein
MFGREQRQRIGPCKGSMMTTKTALLNVPSCVPPLFPPPTEGAPPSARWILSQVAEAEDWSAQTSEKSQKTALLSMLFYMPLTLPLTW